MSLAAVVGRGRARAEARMDSTARIFYASGRGALTNGVQAAQYTDRIPSVKCRFSASADSVTGAETTPAQALGSRLTREVSIPIGSPVVHVGDFLELLSVGSLTDASLATIRWRVIDPGAASQGTARRMLVEVDR